MTAPKPQTLDLTALIDPRPERSLAIPYTLVQTLFAEFATAPQKAALQWAYLETPPAPWPSHLDLDEFDAASWACRCSLEARFVELSSTHLLTDRTVPARLAGELKSTLSSVASRVLCNWPELRETLDLAGQGEALGDFILGMRSQSASVLPSAMPPGPRPESDRASFDLDEWWAALADPRPPQRPRPLNPSARLGRPASEADLFRLLNRRAEDDTAIAGFAPIVERRGRNSTRLEVLPEQTLFLSAELRCTHTLICGRIGSGKTTSWILPMLRSDLADTTRTVVVIDAKGELYAPVAELTARYRPGTEVELINFKEPAFSLGWNPLGQIKNEGQATDLAFALCHATEQSNGLRDNPYWINNSIDLIGGLIQVLDREHPGTACLGDLLDAVGLAPAELARLAGRHKTVKGLARFSEFLATGSHNAETVASDTRMRLRVLRDERICAVTSLSEFDVRGLGSSPRVVVLQIHEEDAASLAPLTGVFLTQLLDGLVSDARLSGSGRLEHHVAIFIEEFASAMGAVPKMASRLNTLRSRNVSVSASVQSLAQIDALYQVDAAAVRVGFSNQIFFPNIAVHDAEQASRAAGEGLFLEETYTDYYEPEPRFASRKDGRQRSSRSRRHVIAPLYLPGEITSPPLHDLLGGAATFLFAGQRPFQAFLTPSFHLRDLGEILAAAAQRGTQPALRERPLVWPLKPKSQTPDRSVSDTTRMSIADLEARTREVLECLGFAAAPESTRTWWREFAHTNRGHQCAVLHLIEAAWRRNVELVELQAACTECSELSFETVILYLDYRLARQLETTGPRAKLPEVNERNKPELVQDPKGRSKPLPQRAQEAREWLERRKSNGWTFQETARRSGLPVNKLRYWSRRLGI